MPAIVCRLATAAVCRTQSFLTPVETDNDDADSRSSMARRKRSSLSAICWRSLLILRVDRVARNSAPAAIASDRDLQAEFRASVPRSRRDSRIEAATTPRPATKGRSRRGRRLAEAGAEAIRGVLGPEDIVARLGGDEFAVILKSGSAAGAKIAARSIIDAIPRPGFTWDGRPHAIGASIGMAAIGAKCARSMRSSPAPTPPATRPRRPAAACFRSGARQRACHRQRRAEPLARAS